MKRVRFHSRGFVLLEALLAVAIFAIGVLALGKCVSNCVAAEHIKVEDGMARRALMNRMAEIEAGSIPALGNKTEALSGAFQGFSMAQSGAPLVRKNEKGADITGIVAVNLTVSWRSEGDTHSRQQTFYVYPRPQ